MNNPVFTLYELTEALLDLDMVQSWIDGARTAAPENQLVQLELDRQQSSLDLKRALIGMQMLDISSRN